MSLLGKAFGALKGFATGGPLGAASALLGKKQGSLPRLPSDSIIQTERYGPGGAFGSKTTKAYFGPQGGYDNIPGGLQPGTQLPMLAAGAACPIGYRLNKSTYITRGGGTSRWGPAGAITVHPKGSTCVKRRRRNVGNARALRRAISRVKGFVKLARKAHSLVGSGRRRTKTKMIGPGGTSIVNVD